MVKINFKMLSLEGERELDSGLQEVSEPFTYQYALESTGAEARYAAFPKLTYSESLELKCSLWAKKISLGKSLLSSGSS